MRTNKNDDYLLGYLLLVHSILFILNFDSLFFSFSSPVYTHTYYKNVGVFFFQLN